MSLRAELAALVEELLRGTGAGDTIELDAIGAAIGARAISQDEIDTILTEIERRGRKVGSSEVAPHRPTKGVRPISHGEAKLKVVLDAARTLRHELGRAPSPSEIAERAGIPEDDVQRALALARVMQR